MALIKRQTALRLLAEFGVIVTGVLVAFAVDDWATRRANRVIEAQYLESLLADLQSDSTLLAATHVPSLALRQARLEGIAKVVRGHLPLPLDTVGFLIGVAESHFTPLLVGRSATYEELVTTGSLRVIESSELRSAMAEYYRLWSRAIVRSESRASGYPEIVRAYLPEGTGASGGGSTTGPSARTPEAVRAFGVSQAAEAIQTSEFALAINRHFNYLGLMRPTVDELLDAARSLITQVESELDRLN